MDINELTLGQIKEIQSLACGTPRTSASGRAVVVVDRGWIFAGDMSTAADGSLRLDNAVHVFRWQEIGFARALTEWKSDRVDLRPCEPVEIPHASVIFRVPVSDEWGIE